MKNIVIIILAVMLILSFAFNMFIMTILEITDIESFKQVILCRELMKTVDQATETTEATVDTDASPTETADTMTDTIVDAPAVNNSKVLYEDTYIKVTYVKQELSLFGPTIKFLVESKSTDTLDVSFTNVYIDGYQADFCGAYVSALEGGKKVFETLYIYESDYEDFTDFPSTIEFVIKVQDSVSWHDLAESSTIIIRINK